LDDLSFTLNDEQPNLPFFLPLHTSIWLQPNDAGINIGFHAAIEKTTKNIIGQQLLVQECQ